MHKVTCTVACAESAVKDPSRPSETGSTGTTAIALPARTIGTSSPPAADLTGVIQSAALIDLAVPTNNASAIVQVQNVGNQRVNQSQVGVYASLDTTLDSSDILLGTSNSGQVNAGQSKNITVDFTIPNSLDPIAYRLLAKVDNANAIAENSETNNVAIGGTVNVAWKFGNVPGRTGSTTLTLKDADGTSVTFSLTGPGLGEVVRDGTKTKWDVKVTSTTASSALTIQTNSSGNGRVTLNDIHVFGPLASLTATSTDLTGTLAIDGPVNIPGTLPGTITLGSIQGGTVAVPSVEALTVLGAISNAKLFIGTTFGQDGKLGGTGVDADTYGQGSIGLFTVTGAMSGTSVRVGINPIDGVYGNGNDQLIGSTSSSIGGIVIGGSLSADTRLYAGAFPAQYLLGLTLKPTAGDSHFISNFSGPALTASLQQDTGSSSSDRLTNNPVITGIMSDPQGIATFTAGFGAIPTFDVPRERQANGSFTFTLTRELLEQINGVLLIDGTYVLKLQATDAVGNSTQISVPFTLDTQVSVLTFDLAASSDTTPVGDQQTTNAIVTLAGQTEALASVFLLEANQTTTADANGNFSFTNVALALGANSFTVRVTDIAGNQGTATRTITRVLADSDGDGVPDVKEGAGPNNGDANHDDILDSQQANVASLQNVIDQQYVTLVSPTETTLVNVRTIENPSPNDTPEDVTFPFGFFGFEIHGVTPGGAAQVTMLLPSVGSVNSFYKYGPEPGSPSLNQAHWYEFNLTGSTGATISGDSVTLDFIDGVRGDSDLSTNGVIVDPGTVAFKRVPVNRAPVLGSIGDRTVNEGVVLTFTATATDSNVGQTRTYRLEGQVPTGASIDPTTGVFTWTPAVYTGPVTVTFDVVVTDNGTPALSDRETIRVTVLEPDAVFFQGVGKLPGGFHSVATGVSADGSVVVGRGLGSSANGGEAFRWTASDGLVGLGDLAGGSFSSQAEAVSADGSVVVGLGSSANGGEAFRWTASDGLVGLGDLASGDFFSLATDVSADGSVVVGLGSSANGFEAFRWTASGGLVGLGALASGSFPSSQALAVSTDGALVVGESMTTAGPTAFVWDAEHGMRAVQTVLTQDFGLGAELTGWTLTQATGIAPDGRTITGVGRNPQGQSEAWRVRLPLNEAPVLGSIGDRTVNEEEVLTFTATATESGVRAQPLTFSLANGVNGTVPEGATITSSGVFSWTPTEAQGPGTYTFDIVVTDNGLRVLSTGQTITVTVNEVNRAPVANDQSRTTAEDTAVAITLTGSDADVADRLGFSIVDQPLHGTLAGSNANLIYTPVANYHGPDSFTFKINDGQVYSNGATVNLTVTPVNDAPVANVQSVTTAEDTAKLIALVGSDVDSDPLAYSVVTGPQHGTLTGTGATRTYTPAANYYGPDSFTFKTNDETVDSNIATVSFTITPVNDAPTGANQTITINEDQAYTFSRTDFGFTDPLDSPPNAFRAVTITALPGSGTLTLNGTPANAGDSLTIARAGVTWTAQESSRQWFAMASSADGVQLVAAVFGGQLYTSTDAGVTWTARESSRQWWSVASSADGTKLVAVSGGSLYTSTDAGVTWTLHSRNHSWQSVALSADGTKLVAAVFGGQLYTSTDAGVTWTARESSRNWQSVASSADGVQLVAAVRGGQLYTSTDAGVTWTARESSRNWQSVASSADGTKLVAGVLGGYLYTSTDAGVTWTARASIQPWQSVASSADGTKLVAGVLGGYLYTSVPEGLVYTPAANVNGNGLASVIFQVQDTGGTANGGVDLDQSPNTITFNVTPVADAPTGANQTITINEDQSYIFSAEDFGFADVDGDALEAVRIDSLTLPVGATLQLGDNAVTAGQIIAAGSLSTLVFTSTMNTSGTAYASFTFSVRDASLFDIAPNSVTFDVTSVNDAPIAVDDAFTTPENTAIRIPELALLANDSDPDGDVLSTLSGGTSPLAGQVTHNADGSFTYQPNTGFVGTDRFTYLASDGLLSAPATVTITVTPVNDVPVLANAGAGATFTEDGAAVVINSALTVTDADNTTLSSGTVTLTNGQAGDQLTFTNVPATMGNIAGSVAGGVLTLTSSGVTATLAQWQAALRSVTFSTASQNPNTTARSVAFVVTDGTLSSNTITSSVAVVAVNDAPVVTRPASVTATEGVVFAFTAGNRISVADVDAGTSLVQITLGVTNGTLTITTLTGLTFTTGDGTADASMVFTGTLTNINTALATLSYLGNVNVNGSDTLTVTANDQGATGTGGPQSDTKSVVLTVTSFQGLGRLTDGSGYSIPSAMSGDGNVVFGQSSSTIDFGAPFRWTVAGGMEDLTPLIGGSPAHISAVSFDGSVLVGDLSDGTSFRWSQSAGLQTIEDSPPTALFTGSPRAVSADGTVVVGKGLIDQFGPYSDAYRWTAATGVVRLPSLPEFPASGADAVGVSADGNVIVGSNTGFSETGELIRTEAVRWVADGAGGFTVEGLGDLPGGAFNSTALAVSADGTVVFGMGESDIGQEAFLWTASEGMIGLGPESFFLSAMSADASVIVGGKYIWDANHGLRLLSQVLTELDVSVPDSWPPEHLHVNGISADGRTIIGDGTNSTNQVHQEAWRAVLPANDFAPVFDTVLDGNNFQIQVGIHFSLSVSATDGDTPNQLVRYRLIGNVPPRVSLLDDGTFSWDPTIDDLGEYTFTIRAYDSGVPSRFTDTQFMITVWETL